MRDVLCVTSRHGSAHRRDAGAQGREAARHERGRSEGLSACAALRAPRRGAARTLVLHALALPRLRPLHNGARHKHQHLAHGGALEVAKRVQVGSVGQAVRVVRLPIPLEQRQRSHLRASRGAALQRRWARRGGRLRATPHREARGAQGRREGTRLHPAGGTRRAEARRACAQRRAQHALWMKGAALWGPRKARALILLRCARIGELAGMRCPRSARR